jgi:hypothetical protein
VIAVVVILVLVVIGVAIYCWRRRSSTRAGQSDGQYGQVIIDDTDDLAYGLERV